MTPTSAAAEVYRYVDAEGRVHFTGDLERVPPDQREAAEAGATARPPVNRSEAATPDAGAPETERPFSLDPAAREEPGGRDEASWRAEHERLRSRVEMLESQLEMLEAQGADHPPGPRRENVSRRNFDRYQGRYEAWQRTRSQLDGARSALERFEERARRAGVPPGWLR